MTARGGPMVSCGGDPSPHRGLRSMVRPVYLRAMTLDELRAQVEDGTIDTVLLCLTDMQGRLQGKRMHAGFFVDEVVGPGAEACNYLLAVDVEMNTVEGYAMSSWSRGYGDFVMAPDLDTLMAVPWLPRPAPRPF